MADILLRRLVPALAAGGVVAVAAAARWFDPGAAAALLAGQLSEANGLALVAALCWLGIAVIVAVVSGTALARAGAHHHTVLRRTLLLAGAATLLALGILRHLQGFTVCCASPAAAAHQVEQRVR